MSWQEDFFENYFRRRSTDKDFRDFIEALNRFQVRHGQIIGSLLNYLTVISELSTTISHFISLSRQLTKLLKKLKHLSKNSEQGKVKNSEIITTTIKISRVIDELLELLEDIKKYGKFSKELYHIGKNKSRQVRIDSLYKRTRRLQKKYGFIEHNSNSEALVKAYRRQKTFRRRDMLPKPSLIY